MVSGARTPKPVSHCPSSPPEFRPESAVGLWGSWVLFLIHRMAPGRPVVALGAVLGEARRDGPQRAGEGQAGNGTTRDGGRSRRLRPGSWLAKEHKAFLF